VWFNDRSEGTLSMFARVVGSGLAQDSELLGCERAFDWLARYVVGNQGTLPTKLSAESRNREEVNPRVLDCGVRVELDVADCVCEV